MIVTSAIAAAGYFLFGASDSKTITATTYAFADAINRDDFAAAAALMCKERGQDFPDAVGEHSASQPKEPPRRDFTVTAVDVNGDRATSKLTFHRTSTTRELGFHKEDGKWKVCNGE